MPLKIVRNDIVRMHCDAIVNTANAYPCVGPGCDTAVYKAAGRKRLLEFRTARIGIRAEGEAFLTPGFRLPAPYIIHAVSPQYIDGQHGEEEKLRACYRNSMELAIRNHFRSIAFPLIATGSYAYPQEEGLRIAVDELNQYLPAYDITIYLVVFGRNAARLGKRIYPGLQSFIDENYVQKALEANYGISSNSRADACRLENARPVSGTLPWEDRIGSEKITRPSQPKAGAPANFTCEKEEFTNTDFAAIEDDDIWLDSIFENTEEEIEDEYYQDLYTNELSDRLKHMQDTFSEYLLYLIETKKMTNAEVYKRAIVDKKAFSKIKNNPDAHPSKITAMCLCIGAKLNMDETKDLLARAGYALSPSSMVDTIFGFFIEKGIYDMIELSIQLENFGLPSIIE